MSPRSSVVLLALLAGCSLFKLHVDPSTTRQVAGQPGMDPSLAVRAHHEALARQAAHSEAAAAAVRDQQTVAQIEALRGELGAGGPDGAKAMQFAALVRGARDSAAARDGRLDLPALQLEAVTYLEAAPPSYEVFITMAAIANTPATDAAVLRACAKTRPVVPAGQVTDFVALCINRAGGDPKQLVWPGVQADMVVVRKADEDRERAEAEAARAQAQAERAEAEAERIAVAEAERVAVAAEKVAVKAAQSDAARAIAAVFAAGRCNFGNCLKDGWTAGTPAGDVRVTCNFGDCLKDGWTARLPDGSEARTTCNFGDCMKDGWETRYADGKSARTRCNFGACAKDGWETTLPGGGSARTTCNFRDCFKDGWQTQMPSGSVRCSCNFQKCLSDGASCQ